MNCFFRNQQEALFKATKPYQYVGGEFLSYNKDWDSASVRFAFVFPDKYEIGISNLGVRIIYDRVNSQPNMLADRAYAPEPDFKPEQFYRLDAQMHSVWFEATKKQKLWEILQAQQLHYTRFRMLDFVTETDFTRIIKEHEEIFQLIEKKDVSALEEALKDHLYFSMKRMRHQIDVEYRDYFEEEDPEGKFDI